MTIREPSVCGQCGKATAFSDSLCGVCRSGQPRPWGQPTVEQLALLGLGPTVGDRYRNKNTGAICTVLYTEQRKYNWVTIRIHGESATLTLARFVEVFVRI